MTTQLKEYHLYDSHRGIGPYGPEATSQPPRVYPPQAWLVRHPSGGSVHLQWAYPGLFYILVSGP